MTAVIQVFTWYSNDCLFVDLLVDYGGVLGCFVCNVFLRAIFVIVVATCTSNWFFVLFVSLVWGFWFVVRLVCLFAIC